MNEVYYLGRILSPQLIFMKGKWKHREYIRDKERLEKDVEDNCTEDYSENPEGGVLEASGELLRDEKIITVSAAKKLKCYVKESSWLLGQKDLVFPQRLLIFCQFEQPFSSKLWVFGAPSSCSIEYSVLSFSQEPCSSFVLKDDQKSMSRDTSPSLTCAFSQHLFLCYLSHLRQASF